MRSAKVNASQTLERAASVLPFSQSRRVEETKARISTRGSLVEWRRRFLRAWPAIETLGFDLKFKRLWEYYLCYCEAGFRADRVNVGIYTLRHAHGELSE